MWMGLMGEENPAQVNVSLFEVLCGKAQKRFSEVKHESTWPHTRARNNPSQLFGLHARDTGIFVIEVVALL